MRSYSRGCKSAFLRHGENRKWHLEVESLLFSAKSVNNSKVYDPVRPRVPQATVEQPTNHRTRNQRCDWFILPLLFRASDNLDRTRVILCFKLRRFDFQNAS